MGIGIEEWLVVQRAKNNEKKKKKNRYTIQINAYRDVKILFERNWNRCTFFCYSIYIYIYIYQYPYIYRDIVWS